MNGKAVLPARPQEAANNQFRKPRQSSREQCVAPSVVSIAAYADNARSKSMPIRQAKGAAILGSKKAWFRSGFQQLPFVKGARPA
jgi:hypothetical protein